MKENKMSKIIGSLLGGAFGDAAGARLEFDKDITPKKVQEAMELKGGGVFSVAPGQVTDDTELSIQLFKALKEYENSNGTIDVDEYIFAHYKEWYDSNPFDIGRTTRLAFANADVAIDANLNAEIDNFDSESNGALMRCIPIAVYAYENNLSDNDIYTLVNKDVLLTHCKRTVVNLVYVYVCILLQLYNNKSWNDFKNKLNLKNDERLKKIFKEFKNYDKVDVYNLMGWDVHAFSLCLYCLEKNFSFTQAMEFVLSKGGDTDTNAAIVGGVMGAKYGYKVIPHLSKLLSYKPKHNRQNFHPKVYLDYFKIQM